MFAPAALKKNAAIHRNKANDRDDQTVLKHAGSFAAQKKP
jgi:hypothetical protein